MKNSNQRIIDLKEVISAALKFMVLVRISGNCNDGSVMIFAWMN
jgi:hypothetical protein